MTDVLVITGPVNAAQLRQPELSPGTKTIYVGSGGGTGSNDMMASTDAWLGGRDLRSRVELEVPDVTRLGVVWFSAGHGSIQAMLRSGTKPEHVQAWLCLDGLYTAWNYRAQWATQLAEAAMASTTTLLVSASTSTPGQYADSKSAWLEVMKFLELEQTDEAQRTAESLGLPTPDEAFQHGAMLVCAYDDIDHHHQVPAMRDGFATWWNNVRSAQPHDPGVEPPGSAPGDPGTSGTSGLTVLLLALAGAGSIYAASKLLRSK
jgi:hypothetical protein